MKFSRSLNLCDNLIILDGLTGTGKTMFNQILNNFNDLQNGRFDYFFEQLNIANYYQKIDADTFTCIIKLLIDQKFYDDFISREINFRPTDLSSIFKNKKKFSYILNLFSKDGINIEKKINKENKYHFLITHQLLKPMENMLKMNVIKNIKIIEVFRHPIYLVDHWYSYINMHGNNARDFTLWFKYKNIEIPWFAEDWKNDYISLDDYNRSVMAISKLTSDCLDIIDNNKYKDKILNISFEHFVLNTYKYIRDLELFLDLKFSPSLFKILRKQNLPRKYIYQSLLSPIYSRYGVKKYDKLISHSNDYNERLNNIKSKCNENVFKIFNKSIEKYNDIFKIWF